MTQTSGIIRRIGSLLLIAATLLGLYNVYSDNADVRVLAQKTACGERPCSAKLGRESRSPIGQSFSYEVELDEPRKVKRHASVDVECTRSFYLVGEYKCTGNGVLPP